MLAPAIKDPFLNLEFKPPASAPPPAAKAFPAPPKANPPAKLPAFVNNPPPAIFLNGFLSIPPNPPSCIPNISDINLGASLAKINAPKIRNKSPKSPNDTLSPIAPKIKTTKEIAKSLINKFTNVLIVICNH